MSLDVTIKYGTDHHRNTLAAVRERYQLSQRKMSERHTAWEDAEELFRGYIKETDEAKARKQKIKEGEPQYITLQIPFSYAVLLTAHTYWTSVFLSRTPIFQYTGRHGETQQQVQAMEALIAYQTHVGRMLPHLYMWLLDPGKYGIGIIGNYWEEEEHVVSNIVEQPRTFAGIQIMDKVEKVREIKRMAGYKGNKIFNVRPYDFYPDPRVSLLNFQDGEFCGRRVFVGWNTILKRADAGQYFNIEELEQLKKSGRIEGVYGSSQISMPERDGISFSADVYGSQGSVELVEMVVELSPKEWKLGEGEYPEKWVFTMAQDAIIIGARPLGAYHNQFPYLLMSYETDMYSMDMRSMMEVLEPLNQAMTWLLNSHFFNVRKGLNDQLVADPSRVVMKDLTDGGPGRIIRLRPGAYGSDVRAAVHQLPVADVTQGHLKGMEVLVDIIQRVSGVTDNVMGMVNPGGRKTATEVRTSSSFSVNRLKTHAEFNSVLGFEPLSQMLVQNTQQRYDEEQMFRVAGDLLVPGKTTVEVTPKLIAGFYDFVPVDGTLPIDRFAQVGLWRELMHEMVQIPQIATQYDVAGIFSWVAQLAGIKNISQFKLEVAPDAAMMAQVQAGNSVPVNGGAQR